MLYPSIQNAIRNKDYDTMIHNLVSDWYTAQIEFYYNDNLKPLEERYKELDRIIATTKSDDKFHSARVEIKDIEAELQEKRRKYFEVQEETERVKDSMLEILYSLHTA